MSEQPADYARQTLAEHAIEILPGLAGAAQRYIRARSRGLAWLGFWIAVAVLGTSAMWAYVYELDSRRDHHVRLMQILSQAEPQRSRGAGL